MVEEWFCNSFVFVKKIFQGKMKIFSFFASLIPVTWRNEGQKTFVEDPWSVSKKTHAFDLTNKGKNYTCRWEKISLPLKDAEKQDFGWKRKNKGSQTKSQRVPIWQKQTNLWNPRAHKISRNWFRYQLIKTGNGREKCRKRGYSTFLRLNLVDQFSAVAAFKPFQRVMTWLVIVTGL